MTRDKLARRKCVLYEYTTLLTGFKINLARFLIIVRSQCGVTIHRLFLEIYACSIYKAAALFVLSGLLRLGFNSIRMSCGIHPWWKRYILGYVCIRDSSLFKCTLCKSSGGLIKILQKGDLRKFQCEYRGIKISMLYVHIYTI